MVWLGALWQLVGVLTDLGPTGLVAGTAAAAIVLLATVLATRVPPHRAAGARSRVTRRALRERSGRTGVPRHRDPDAAGRSRPRAPATVPTAA